MDKPIELIGSAVEEFALDGIAAELRGAPEYAANGRNARTLAKAPELNVVLTVIAAGTQVSEHQVAGPVVLTVLEGDLAFLSGGSERLLAAGSTVAIAGGVRHAVRGIKDAAFLLVISRHA